MRYANPRLQCLVPIICTLGQCASPITAAAAPAADQGLSGSGVSNEGQLIAFDPARGNCLACHVLPGGQLPGNVGPPLADVADRYPDAASLRQQIWDAAVTNPNTIMPPYGRNRLLSDQEIDQLVEYLRSLRSTAGSPAQAPAE